MKKLIQKHFKKLFYLSLIGLVLVFGINFYVKSKTHFLIFYSENKIPKNKVGIIFGAGINGDKPSKYLKDRLDAGIKLFKSKKINKILLSGDNGSDAHDELTVMKIYCFKNGIDTTKIYIDYAGFDTYSTMFRAKNIFKIDKAILITQEYHLNRAIYIGNNLGIESIGFSANQGKYRNYNYVRFREYFSICKSVIDVIRNREPHFLGTEININGVSNYSKEDKR
jgi:SanA protein